MVGVALFVAERPAAVAGAIAEVEQRLVGIVAAGGGKAVGTRRTFLPRGLRHLLCFRLLPGRVAHALHAAPQQGHGDEREGDAAEDDEQRDDVGHSGSPFPLGAATRAQLGARRKGADQRGRWSVPAPGVMKMAVAVVPGGELGVAAQHGEYSAIV